MTTTATIRRGSAPRKRPAVKRQARPAPRTKSAARTALERVPIPAGLVQRVTRWVLYLGIAAGIAGAIHAAGIPGMVGTELGEAAGRAGFTVKRIDVRGVDRMDRLAIYAVALDQESTAMPLVDLGMIREKLLRYPWVGDARVSRRLPDTLVVDIVERTPVAVWQHRQKLALIDKDGIVLAPVALDAMPEALPLVIGPAANRQAAPLATLLDAAPALKPMLAGATWVGGRRWDLRFHSGETLALPEGNQAASEALVKFARMDGVARLLGQGFVRFDMRVPGKFVVRVSKEPGKVVAPPVAQKEPV